MKLIFEIDGRNEFEMDVGPYESLQNIKEKVETNKRIPISKQTLSFCGRILRNDDDLLNVIILDGSRIHVHVAADAAQGNTIKVKMSPPLFSQDFNVDFNETIQHLKEKIHEEVHIPIAQIVIKKENGIEMPNHATLLESQILENSEVTVEFLPAPSTSAAHNQPKMDDSDILDQFNVGMPPQEITIMVKFPAAPMPFGVKMKGNETIQQLKQKIQVPTRIPIDQIVMKRKNGMELLDHMTVLQISAESYVTVEHLPPPEI